jgi:hypothetical protein
MTTNGIKTARVRFDGHQEMAKNLHTLLYWCLVAGRAHNGRQRQYNRMQTLRNGAYLNDYYDLIPIDSTCVIPETPVKWFDLERENAYHVVSKPDFVLEEKVRLGTLHPYETLKI